MNAYIDDGDNIIQVNEELVKGLKLHGDGSQLFSMLGGPYHGMHVRQWAPYERIVFTPKTGSNAGVHTYRISPPAKAGGKWVYVYDPEDKREYSAKERGDPVH